MLLWTLSWSTNVNDETAKMAIACANALNLSHISDMGASGMNRADTVVCPLAYLVTIKGAR
jgi:hypothetical protein